MQGRGSRVDKERESRVQGVCREPWVSSCVGIGRFGIGVPVMVNVKGDRLIPCEALWPIMEDFKRQFESTQPAEDSRRNLYASGGTGQNHEAAWIICLSEISNVSPRRIRGILSGGMDGRDTISFSMADQLVVAMEEDRKSVV